MEWSSLIVIEDATHRRAIIEYHGAGGIDLGCCGVLRRLGHGRAGTVVHEPPRRLGILPLEHCLLDLPQATHLLSHLDLGVAVGLQNRLGHITEEVVVTVTVWHAGEFRRDARHEGVLPIGQPQRHRLAQGLGPRPGLGDQTTHLSRRRGDQWHGEPHAFPRQFPHHVQGLVPLLGLQAVDREDDLIDALVVLPQRLGILLAAASMTW